MERLFIIGNGFDKAHNLNTSYYDFKEYIIRRYPKGKKGYSGLLEGTSMPDGVIEYNLEEVVGSIIKTIDECGEDAWGALEECLGGAFIDTIYFDNQWAYSETNIEDEHIFRSIYENEDITQSVTDAYKILSSLFRDWVYEDLSSIKYDEICPLNSTPIFDDGLFLSFNYTMTLEMVYGVSNDRICHIHGAVINPKSRVYFGHGDDSEFKEFPQFIGADRAYNSLKRFLRKDTSEALYANWDFFEKIKGVKEIYTFGFSFSDVDMIYLEEICSRIDVNAVTWYINNYDWINNPYYVDVVKKMGFTVKKSEEW